MCTVCFWYAWYTLVHTVHTVQFADVGGQAVPAELVPAAAYHVVAPAILHHSAAAALAPRHCLEHLQQRHLLPCQSIISIVALARAVIVPLAVVMKQVLHQHLQHCSTGTVATVKLPGAAACVLKGGRGGGGEC